MLFTLYFALVDRFLRWFGPDPATFPAALKAGLDWWDEYWTSVDAEQGP